MGSCLSASKAKRKKRERERMMERIEKHTQEILLDQIFRLIFLVSELIRKIEASLHA